MENTFKSIWWIPVHLSSCSFRSAVCSGDELPFDQLIVPAAKSGIAAGDGEPYRGFNTPLDQADMIHVGWVWI